ncbi:MAG: hypothetical protein CBC73_02590 [Flavobacteriales bacterium TMED113]|nr:MAG: hypothetical protein CBC73_02590 [Flavobacteriales bacterium TMED113]
MNLLKTLNFKLLFFFLFSLSSFGQNNTIKKATILSAACPGLGQVYNKKYWKTPVILIGIGACIYSYKYSNNKFEMYKEAYILRNDDDDNTIDEYDGLYSNSNLITLQDYYRNNKDLSIVYGSILYILNIVDAYVDAHLLSYNINDNLSFYIRPEILDNSSLRSLISMKINF